MSHVTRMHESCPTCKWVMSHVWISHATLMHESCHTYEWVMSHVWMSHMGRVMSHVWMSHVTRMNESCHTYEGVMSHVSCHTYEGVMKESRGNLLKEPVPMGHVTRMNESCHVMSQSSYAWHVMSSRTLIHMSWVILQHTAALLHTATHCNSHDMSCHHEHLFICHGHVMSHGMRHVIRVNESCESSHVTHKPATWTLIMK